MKMKFLPLLAIGVTAMTGVMTSCGNDPDTAAVEAVADLINWETNIDGVERSMSVTFNAGSLDKDEVIKVNPNASSLVSQIESKCSTYSFSRWFMYASNAEAKYDSLKARAVTELQPMLDTLVKVSGYNDFYVRSILKNGATETYTYSYSRDEKILPTKSPSDFPWLRMRYRRVVTNADQHSDSWLYVYTSTYKGTTYHATYQTQEEEQTAFDAYYAKVKLDNSLMKAFKSEPDSVWVKVQFIDKATGNISLEKNLERE